MADPCIFCAKPGGSGEHLWSDKIGPEIEAYYRSSAKRSVKAVGLFASEFTIEESGMPLYATKIRCVCHECNNRWMNRLDTRVRNKLIRLMRGQEAEYSKLETIDLASWLAMKFIVRDEFKRTKSIFSAFDKHNFYLTGRPPAGMWIGLALCGEPVWAGAFQRLEGPPIRALAIEKRASWAMGLGATVAIGEYPTLATMTDRIEEKVLPIWPRPTAFEWPARPRLTSAALRQIAVRLNPIADSVGDIGHPEATRRPKPTHANRHQRRRAAKEQS